MRVVDVVEDYRLIVVATRSGWQTFAILDDGVELLEQVDVTVTPET